jgi:hypothetical protein
MAEPKISPDGLFLYTGIPFRVAYPVIPIRGFAPMVPAAPFQPESPTIAPPNQSAAGPGSRVDFTPNALQAPAAPGHQDSGTRPPDRAAQPLSFSSGRR